MAFAARAASQTERSLDYLLSSLNEFPPQPQAHADIAALLLELQRPGDALVHTDQALSWQPHHPGALYNRGNALLALGQPAAALASYDQALQVTPALAAAWNNRGTALYRLHRLDEALDSYRKALGIQADYPSALNNCGNVLRDLDFLPQSLQYLDRALRLRPHYAGALCNRGHSLLRLGEHAEAASCFAGALQLELHFDAALGFLHYARAGACDWTDRAELVERLSSAVAQPLRVSLPFPLLFATSSAAAQLLCAQVCSAMDSLMSANPLTPIEPYGHDRLRIGYLSPDFRDHAVAYLMAGVFEHHDKGRFEVTALSLRPADTSAYGQRIARAVDRFVDLSHLSDGQAAAQIRALEIDVLVDLVGHTQGSRVNILAQRPSPVQVNYLGYPGTSGAPYIDYLIADDYVIPPQAREHYSESIVYLPDCFQANDDRRATSSETPSRALLDLPADALVLCCFNNSFKLTPEYFDVWMRLLRAAPGAVLWLVAQQPLAQQNLRREARQRGIDPDRLIFASSLPYEQHLARLGAADLFLDTLPFNGGTTVSDALWAGLPVLTCSGEAFASRMGGSLLRAMKLDELICSNLERYEEIALGLLADRRRLTAVKTHLVEQRQSSVLFDTARVTRHLEAAYDLMWRRWYEGQPAQHLHVPPLPRAG